MRKMLTVLLVAISVSAGAQTNNQAAAVKVENKPEVLIMKQVNHDFGKIQQGRPVTYNFEIVNGGTDALRIENVQASCGCTTPEWSFEAVKPGATTSVKVGYNSAAVGPFQKTVTIIYNGGQTKTLIISGNVYPAAATSAPTNASIALLKQTN